ERQVGDRQAQVAAGEVREEGDRVVGRAARDGGDQGGWVGLQRHGGLPRRAAAEQPLEGVGLFVDLAFEMTHVDSYFVGPRASSAAAIASRTRCPWAASSCRARSGSVPARSATIAG